MKHMVKQPHPIRVLQFGEGNFLRAFADAVIDAGNRAGILDCGVAIVKPRNSGSLQIFKDQNCNYTTAIRGLENGQTVEAEQVITCVQEAVQPHLEPDAYRAIYMGKDLKFVISNTTEAGILYDPTDTCHEIPRTFPGKLCKILYDRYFGYHGAADAGLYMIPCELIEDNGTILKQCVESYAKLWGYGQDFLNWVDANCIFAGTLVDRIVSGYPKDNAEAFEEKLGYHDPLLVVAEPYQLWAIEADARLREALPLDKVTDNVIFTDDVRPYRQRKVRILNGCHTLLTPVALLWGKEYVRQCMNDAALTGFLEKAVTREIIPTMDCLPKEALFRFYEDVKNRFANPYLDHSLKAISLNTVSKFSARLLPSIEAYYAKFKMLPQILTFGFAAMLAYILTTDSLSDTEDVLTFLNDHRDADAADYVKDAICRYYPSLLTIPGFSEAATGHLNTILTQGIHAALTEILEDTL